MIIVRLRGGLGNQLFQYAAARALADHHGTELKLDLYTYTKHKYRKFELSHFNINAKEATRAEVHQFTGNNPVVRYLNKRENYFHCPYVFAQPHYHFYDDFFSLPGNLYLSGYWQSEKYFLRIADSIRTQYTPALPLDKKNNALQSEMAGVNSIAVHIRRGDYTWTGNSFFGVMGRDYYDAAIARIKEAVPEPKFYFFSDDPEWCRQNFQVPDAEFISHNSGDSSFKDLLLMSACRHNIIANSTFSWWGAWLNRYPEKKVIAPSKWFGLNYLTKKEPVYASRYYNTKDLIPGSWERI